MAAEDTRQTLLGKQADRLAGRGVLPFHVQIKVIRCGASVVAIGGRRNGPGRFDLVDFHNR